MFVCVCNAITEAQVRECVAEGANTLEDLQIDLGVASCCGTCAETARSYLPGVRVEPRLEVLEPVGGTPVIYVARGPRRQTQAA